MSNTDLNLLEVVIDTDTQPVQQLSYDIAPNTSRTILFTITGSQKGDIRVNVSVGRDARVTTLTINHCNQQVSFKERYDLHENSETVIARAELGQQDVDLKTEYNLLERNARLKVQTVSLTNSHKNFSQKTVHFAGDTYAEVNNYGVVLEKGYCDIVVENTINKGAHHSSTHQSSRLLTNDSRATGKILPILYIYDNEVEASHAASLGQPDDEQLYYLQSRGLSHGNALRLIVIGYLMPITRIIDNEEVNRLLEQEIETKVTQECMM